MALFNKTKNIFEIQELIKKKYPEVDYNELDQDLDRGVWN